VRYTAGRRALVGWHRPADNRAGRVQKKLSGLPAREAVRSIRPRGIIGGCPPRHCARACAAPNTARGLFYFGPNAGGGIGKERTSVPILVGLAGSAPERAGQSRTSPGFFGPHQRLSPWIERRIRSAIGPPGRALWGCKMEKKAPREGPPPLVGVCRRTCEKRRGGRFPLGGGESLGGPIVVRSPRGLQLQKKSPPGAVIFFPALWSQVPHP